MLRTVDDDANSVATAADGTVFVAGSTYDAFDGQPSHGGDAFITKYAADGTKKWTRLAGGAGVTWGYSASTAADGSVYVAGGTYTEGSIDGQASNGGGAFVTKYAADGTQQWTRLAGGTGEDRGYSVATDASGSVYVAGTTYSSIDGQANLGGNFDSFVIKFAANGTKQWTRPVARVKILPFRSLLLLMARSMWLDTPTAPSTARPTMAA